ncbi:MAG: gluconate 2-dehydrogenase subunit 3 family protein [Lewinellaceae bacterium]|nr:gluconate 2-dehydrogenase subunit 3 family protein [Lewinellaceae bacterium]
MDRREAIKRTALLTGFAISSSTIASLLQGCQPEAKSPLDAWTPKFFTKEQGVTLAEIGECILPKTDTPGAKDVFAHEFVDLMVADCKKPEDKELFRNGMAQLMAGCEQANGKSFLDCSPEQQLAFLNEQDQAARAVVDADPGLDDADYPFFLKLKQLILLGYFTSETVGKEVLVYDPVPGVNEACRPYEAGTPDWAPNR